MDRSGLPMEKMSHCEILTGGFHVHCLKSKAILCFFLFVIRKHGISVSTSPLWACAIVMSIFLRNRSAFSSFMSYRYWSLHLSRILVKYLITQLSCRQAVAAEVEKRFMRLVPGFLSLHCIVTRSRLQDQIDPCFPPKIHAPFKTHVFLGTHVLLIRKEVRKVPTLTRSCARALIKPSLSQSIFDAWSATVPLTAVFCTPYRRVQSISNTTPFNLGTRDTSSWNSWRPPSYVQHYISWRRSIS